MSRKHLRSVCQNELIVPCHKLSTDLSESHTHWNSLADYLHDWLLNLTVLQVILKTFLFAHY